MAETGTFACPTCGVTKPHSHAPPEDYLETLLDRGFVILRPQELTGYPTAYWTGDPVIRGDPMLRFSHDKFDAVMIYDYRSARRILDNNFAGDSAVRICTLSAFQSNHEILGWRARDDDMTDDEYEAAFPEL